MEGIPGSVDRRTRWREETRERGAGAEATVNQFSASKMKLFVRADGPKDKPGAE